jgi:phosphopantetheinyl transferase (holo-ACP synthase)
MGEQERSEYLTALWTAKEAIYKSLANQAELEMLTDIRVKLVGISSLPATACTVNGQKVFLQKFQNNFVSVISQVC